ncbi:hypothetical protein PQG83_18490 [Candidatus Nitrospira neomarina]|uniref:Rad50/SbcC-type AAA domain-containing protein n=1 Tax=Candidatus Nitrospira neomarina TaxID=3020899 RepID=A0AA96K032_9BACT|nr:hypothetical protein [Candidatus Nitrospira neomarina]WNM61711.1 hypothetical protein PQG83_18490 [Candidatus Nitrospira neomarina]
MGRNHTGKSSLIKTLFLTLGARPQGDLAQWDEKTISAVDFCIDKKRYRAVHQLRHRALFNETNDLIIATNNHDKWAETFAKTVGFNLVLTDKNLETVQADPRCFFLPFYINQDGSWQSSWNTFIGLQQYRKPTGTILDYFSGIKPPEYYELNSQRTQKQRALEDLQKERQFLDRARERFSESMTLSGPKLQPDNFEQEISRLTSEVTVLNKKQEMLRDTAVREEEQYDNIQLQIELANNALATHEGDSFYLLKEAREKLTCPTCGAEHLESFFDLLTYAEDARILRDLVTHLQEDATKIREQHQKTLAKKIELEKHYQKVSEILSIRRGALQFNDVVNSMGAERAFRVFEEQNAALKGEIDQKLSDIETLDTQLKELGDKKRSREILQTFRQTYSSALVSLNLPPIDTSKLRLTSRPDLSGSGGPRSILAYYGALWRTCIDTYGAFSIPLVIDAPNQQGQDDINLPKVLTYIADDLPEGVQVIVGIEIDTPHFFDNKVVLDQQYKLLHSEEYDAVRDEIDPLVRTMYHSLQNEGLG